jgi:hypothetical protein
MWAAAVMKCVALTLTSEAGSFITDYTAIESTSITDTSILAVGLAGILKVPSSLELTPNETIS